MPKEILNMGMPSIYLPVASWHMKMQPRYSTNHWHGCCRAVANALRPGHTKVLMLESPTNPRMQICDIATLTKMAHQVTNPS